MAHKYGKLAGRYAAALMRTVNEELGTEASGTDGSPTPAQKIASALDSFVELWRSDPQLASTLLNPIFDKTERGAALSAVAKLADLPDVAQRFLKVVYSRDRVAALPDIAQSFTQLADQQAGLIQAQITVARDISEEERGNIEQHISKGISLREEDTQVAFSWKVEPEILGGLIVRYGGRIFDGSVGGRLARIEKQLSN